MGMTGQAGNARAGFSGAAGSALGEQMRKATGNVAMNAWDMISPIQQAEWMAELERGRTGYEDVRDQSRAEWMADLERQQRGYEETASRDQSQWLAELERRKTGYEDVRSQDQLQWMMEAERSKEDYQNLLNELQSEYAGDVRDWQYRAEEEMFPYQVLPAMLGGTYSSPLVSSEAPYTFGQGAQDAGSIMSSIWMANELK